MVSIFFEKIMQINCGNKIFNFNKLLWIKVIFIGEKLVYPSLKLVTTEVAEEDYIEAENSNQIFYIEFGNSNRFSSITITLMLISSEIIETHRLPLDA